MFVHPRCPCSRASLDELDAIMNTEGEAAAATVVFLRPEGAASGWEQTDTWESAGRIPHATRVVDRGGREAARFGARTSGHVVLYDPDGRLEFSGGITGARGHAGDNVGRQMLLRLLAHASTDGSGHAVFGCPMEDPAGRGRVARSLDP